MKNSTKKSLIIASVIAVVLIAVLLAYCFIFLKNDDSVNENSSNNSLFENSKSVNTEIENDSEIMKKISSGNIVDAKTNDKESSKIKAKTDLLENIKINKYCT